MADPKDPRSGPPDLPPPASDVKPVQITDEMRRSYLDYAMSVIVSRRAARRPRRPEAGAPAHPLHDVRERLHARQAVQEVGPRRRRRDGQVPPARQPGDLRRARAHGAGLLDAPAADRRAGQFRLDRQRPAGGRPLHRGPPRQGGDAAPRRPRQGHGRLHGELLGRVRGAERAPGEVPEPPRQRRRRHRRRHGDEHPAAQSRRGHRRLHGLYRRPGDLDRRPDRDRAGAGLPDRRPDPRPGRRARRLPHRPRLDHHAGEVAHRRRCAASARRSSSPRSPTR